MTPTITPEAARQAEERQRFETWARRSGLFSDSELVWQDAPLDMSVGEGYEDHGFTAYRAWLAAKQDAAPTSASTVPTGFWLAPMEPDDDMLAAMGMVGHINEFWPAMRDSYLARNPGACSVTDGEAKK